MSAVPPLTASEVTLEDLYNCTRIFEAIAADTLILAKLTEQERIRLFMAAGASHAS
jgi:hypothetical protein